MQTTKHQPALQKPFMIQTNNYVSDEQRNGGISPKSINPVQSSSTKARGGLEDAFAGPTQNAPKAKNQPRMFGDESRDARKEAQKPLTLDTNQMFYPREFGAANKMRTQDMSSVIKQAREEAENLNFYVQESTKEDLQPTESEDLCIVQQPARGNQKLPI